MTSSSAQREYEKGCIDQLIQRLQVRHTSPQHRLHPLILAHRHERFQPSHHCHQTRRRRRCCNRSDGERAFAAGTREAALHRAPLRPVTGKLVSSTCRQPNIRLSTRQSQERRITKKGGDNSRKTTNHSPTSLTCRAVSELLHRSIRPEARLTSVKQEKINLRQDTRQNAAHSSSSSDSPHHRDRCCCCCCCCCPKAEKETLVSSAIVDNDERTPEPTRTTARRRSQSRVTARARTRLRRQRRRSPSRYHVRLEKM